MRRAAVAADEIAVAALCMSPDQVFAHMGHSLREPGFFTAAISQEHMLITTDEMLKFMREQRLVSRYARKGGAEIH